MTVVLVLCFVISFPLYPETIKSVPTSTENQFVLDTKTESLLFATGLGLFGGSYIFEHFILPEAETIDPSSLDKNDLNWFDQWAMQPYDKDLNTASNVLEGISLLIPGFFMLSSQADLVTVGVMYTEALILAYGLKELGKTWLPRTRPYMYFDGYPQDKVDNGDWDRSFPSGHTTMAFTSAAFTSYVFNSYYPTSKWKIPVTLGSFGIASATAVLRITSGNHFPTDVLGGALIGTLSGFLVPWLHKNSTTGEMQNKLLAGMSILPNGLSFTLKI
jgi:undecaprenyl-diphosphatase